MLTTTGLLDVFLGNTNVLPNIRGEIHELFSKIMIGLVIAHLAGLFHYQVTKSDLLGRMGIKLFVNKN